MPQKEPVNEVNDRRAVCPECHIFTHYKQDRELLIYPWFSDFKNIQHADTCPQLMATVMLVNTRLAHTRRECAGCKDIINWVGKNHDNPAGFYAFTDVVVHDEGCSVTLLVAARLRAMG